MPRVHVYILYNYLLAYSTRFQIIHQRLNILLEFVMHLMCAYGYMIYEMQIGSCLFNNTKRYENQIEAAASTFT